MAPKMGQIYEDGSEDFDGTFKVHKMDQQFKGFGGGGGLQLPNDIRKLDSLLDTTNLALE